MRSMLTGAPWLLAHKSMLAVNQPQKVTLYGKDYVLWKDTNAAVHALLNNCPHMGAMLSAGWCAGKSNGTSAVVCPFHALAFDAEGCTVLPGSGKKTQPLLEPLELVVQGDLIWSYGGHEPKVPIPTLLNDIAVEYDFIGVTGDRSVPTNLLSMLLNMHDYNHQNGTHRSLFEITEVQFKQFIDEGHQSHAYYDMPRTEPKLADVLGNPALLALPKVLTAHLENIFPSLVVFHGESPLATLKQCHLFIPEAENRTRTYVLMFMQAHNAIAHLLKPNFLKLADVVVKQDADILGKIYPETPQKIKLNNEVGMDWVRRNFTSFPEVVAPNLSK